MEYIITFLEGIITFISPCVLPLLPVYILYFSCDGFSDNSIKKNKIIINAIGFVGGFTFIFLILGLLSGTIGSLLVKYQNTVNIITGGIVVIFGLHYTGVLNIRFLNRTIKPDTKLKPHNIISAFVFGMVFSIGWSPCTGAFLGSAIMLASSQNNQLKGMMLLLSYSLGLGIPFIICAVIIEKLQNAINFIKQHYKIINFICGVFLVFIGILMMTGLMHKLVLSLA